MQSTGTYGLDCEVTADSAKGEVTVADVGSIAKVNIG
jgi:hypothetical protein